METDWDGDDMLRCNVGLRNRFPVREHCCGNLWAENGFQKQKDDWYSQASYLYYAGKKAIGK